MKVLYLDLNPLDTSVSEDYSVNPKRYGGGAIFARWMKEEYGESFKIVGHEVNFNNLSDKENRNQFTYADFQQKRILSGELVEDVLDFANGFDVLMSHNPSVFLNTKKKQATWCPGYLEKVDSGHKNLFLYNDFQSPVIQNKITRVFGFTLSPDIKDDKSPINKENFIFYCGRICHLFSTIETAIFCNINKIKCYFSGPIEDNYDFLRHIDNKNTFYLGQISELTKKEFLSKAIATTYIHKWPTPMNLTAIQSLGCGTPIISLNNGFFKSVIKDGENGFFINDNGSDLLEKINKCKSLDYYKIREDSCRDFSINKMTSEIWSGLEFIYNEDTSIRH